MKMRLTLAPILLLLAAQQGPFRFDLAPKDPPANFPANQTVQMQAIYGSFRGLGQLGGNKDLTSQTSWSGSDGAVATVDPSTGLVTPTGNGGSVTITGTSGRFSSTSTLVFNPFTCAGETYDVNRNIFDGCEITDPAPGNHTQGAASSGGSKTCNDTDTGQINGFMPSDSRVHNPAISAFNSATGAAPDFYSVLASGGAFCTNDYAVTVGTLGGGNTACYQFTIITDKLTNAVTVNGNGGASFSGGSGSYSDNSVVYFKIQKICNLPVQENVNYTVNYHL